MLSRHHARTSVPAALLLGTFVAAVGCRSEGTSEEPAPKPSTATAPDPAATLVLGDVEANMPIRRIRWIQPLADHLAAGLAEHGIQRGRVVVARDLQQMARHLEDGTVDVYLDSPLPTLAVQRLAGSEIILRRWVGDERVYWSVFAARADQEIQALDDLRGRVVAFQEKHSTTGFLLPVHSLLEQGYPLREVRSPQESVAADEIGYFFSGDEENTVDMLRTGRVAVGALSSQDLDALPAELRQQLQVVAHTDRLPRQLVSVRPGLDPELVRGIRGLLLGLTDADREALAGAVDGGGWTWVFEDLSDEPRAGLERFTGTIERLVGTEDP
jgi:phosphonate transport system substrate-binding protein